MNVSKMREELVKICENISSKGCMTGYCPLSELCTSSRHIPRMKEYADIITMYNEAVKQGLIKED